MPDIGSIPARPNDAAGVASTSYAMCSCSMSDAIAAVAGRTPCFSDGHTDRCNALLVHPLDQLLGREETMWSARPHCSPIMK